MECNAELIDVLNKIQDAISGLGMVIAFLVVATCVSGS